jgi:hypothetical protein
MNKKPNIKDAACGSPYQRFGSGDGEREVPMTRQMPYDPLPASVLLPSGYGLKILNLSFSP